jgi:hypothetical protein
LKPVIGASPQPSPPLVRQASFATSALISVAYMERRVTKGAPAGMASDMATSSTTRS